MKENTILKEKVQNKVQKPKMYKVMLHNDDYTTMQFVVEILVTIFKRSSAEATKIMFDVHKKGVGIAGIYPYDIAATKAEQADKLAKENGFPLRLSVEEE